MQPSDEEVAPEHEDAPEDDLTIHKRICGSLVTIVCYNPPMSRRQIGRVFTGVVVTSDDNFCDVIAFWGRVLHDENYSAYRFEIILPDGTRVNLDRSHVKIENNLALFTVPTQAKVNPVTFSEREAATNDTVFAVGFRVTCGVMGEKEPEGVEEPELITSYRSPGLVTHARTGFFSHDCPPSAETYDGDPIFNNHKAFVGITFKDRGIAVAISISKIRYVLGKFHPGMAGKPLTAILQCIREKAAKMP